VTLRNLGGKGLLDDAYELGHDCGGLQHNLVRSAERSRDHSQGKEGAASHSEICLAAPEGDMD